MSADMLVQIQDLSMVFPTPAGDVHALKNVSFNVRRGSITGLVGESGSGKTTLGRAVLRLIEATSGKVTFDGQNIFDLDDKAMRAMRRRMQIIFQDPYSSLNPRMRIRKIIEEGLVIHGIGSSAADRRDRVAALLEEVGLQADHMTRFAHEFSGGQRQRIGIARALAVEPDFIVADESVSALDVSVQAQILNLLQDLREKRGLTILFIAHDLSVVEYLCDDLVVLYLGRVAEAGPAELIHTNPVHPYTQALMSAIPVPDPTAQRNRQILRGDIPSPLSPPSGCVFRTRCAHAVSGCGDAVPAPLLRDKRWVACSNLDNLANIGGNM